MSFTGHRRLVFCSAAHAQKLKNKSSAQLVCVNTLLIAEATHTHFSMDQHDILYNCVVWPGCCSQLARSVGFYSRTLLSCSVAPPEYLPLCWHLDQCLSLSPLSLLFICIRASPFFPLTALSPPSPRISQALCLLAAPSLSLALILFLSPSSSSISHLLSGVSVSARQGRPWSDLAGNELLITSQETRHSTPTHPTATTLPPTLPLPHPMQHTPKGERKKKLNSYRMLSPQREIVLERQGSRAEVQMKSV